MKYSMILVMAFLLAACSGEASKAEGVLEAADAAQAPAEVTAESKAPALASADLPNFAEYPGVCPKDWGIVAGAAQAHVENFIQNYFFVPKSSASPMYSDIRSFSVAGGATLVKAGTYKMVDAIVDQEMLVTFAAGKMTQCGSRLRCDANPNIWVASCD